MLSDEVQAQTAEQIDRIKRMAADGPRVLEEMKAQIAETERSVAAFAEQAESGETFAERDEGRIGLSQAEERLIGERAVLNAVDRLIRLKPRAFRSIERLSGHSMDDPAGVTLSRSQWLGATTYPRFVVRPVAPQHTMRRSTALIEHALCCIDRELGRKTGRTQPSHAHAPGSRRAVRRPG
ncbi:hypothetical protein [Bradyrhizobium sp. 15]|uniref:hypothetical protein n=1 Tax=Bradyrhizobium sp. 15 TaxID=2782633 RepID=UPI001FF7CC99|nr:hypothetical protein [Bradyrhizobium sp. 15]MCK1439789.1 hypothetical protein [Bradyrhizobium sp. 15]